MEGLRLSRFADFSYYFFSETSGRGHDRNPFELLRTFPSAPAKSLRAKRTTPHSSDWHACASNRENRHKPLSCCERRPMPGTPMPVPKWKPVRRSRWPCWRWERSRKRMSKLISRVPTRQRKPIQLTLGSESTKCERRCKGRLGSSPRRRQACRPLSAKLRKCATFLGSCNPG